jgi:hypothetical protein
MYNPAIRRVDVNDATTTAIRAATAMTKQQQQQQQGSSKQPPQHKNSFETVVTRGSNT